MANTYVAGFICIIVILFFLLLILLYTYQHLDDEYSDNVIYRYVPRTDKEEEQEPVIVSDIFKTMFSQPGVWESGVTTFYPRESEPIGKYGVSRS